jgi:hypothetical protein
VIVEANGSSGRGWTYSDVERALQSWLAVDGTLAKCRERLAAEVKAGERSEFERLQKKFG